MREGKLKVGDHMYIVRTEHYVTLRVYCTALTDYYYGLRESFNNKLSKKEAETILRKRLFFYGIQGEYPDGYFHASFEESERYNEIYSKAIEWVKSSYKWLNRQET